MIKYMGIYNNHSLIKYQKKMLKIFYNKNDLSLKELFNKIGLQKNFLPFKLSNCTHF